MTIVNESVRLFFAIFALILVGMLSAPMGEELIKPTDITAERTLASAKLSGSHKMSRKKISKIAKSTRKMARRG